MAGSPGEDETFQDISVCPPVQIFVFQDWHRAGRCLWSELFSEEAWHPSPGAPQTMADLRAGREDGGEIWGGCGG